jgi:cell division septation protein DedD
MRGFKQTARNPQASAPQGDRGEDPRRSLLRYKIHLSSFKSRARADKLRKDVAKKGYRATVEAVSGAYRVSVGDFASRDAARKAARTLGRTFRVDPLIVASK